MPRFSAFQSTHFTSEPSHQEKIYDEMVRLLGSGQNYTDDFDSLAMARIYAFAMAFGRVKYELERAGSQFSPDKALDLLPALEREYGLVPEQGATVSERRRDLAVAMRVARGARRTNVESVLAELFGSAFIKYITIPVANAVLSTSTPAARGVYDLPGTPRTIWRLTHAISLTFTPVAIELEIVAGDRVAPEPGRRVVIDSGDHGRVEAVTVATAAFVGPTLMSLTATFTKAHTAGTLLATGRHPNLASTKRRNLFLMSADAVRENKKRRKLHRNAHRLLRGVSVWAATDGSGPFKVGVGRLGITTIGTVT